MMVNNRSGLPKSSVMTGMLSQKKNREFAIRNTQLLLRPTEEGKFYRLRLIQTEPDKKFMASSNFSYYRDYQFILQYVHQVWETIPTDDPDKPKHILKSIVCPQTDYVKANSTLSKSQCPMCNAYGAAFKAYADSHYKNQEAKQKCKNLHNTFLARCLVYIVNDPNYEANNGGVKVLTLDEDAYKTLTTVIQSAQNANTPIWNNDACDLFFTWGKVKKIVNEGKPNQYEFEKNGFTRIGFTTSAKHLDSLTDELVDDVQFDANWYTVPTKEELEQFYVENFTSQSSMNDDIPMLTTPTVVATPSATPATKKVVNDPVASDVDVDSDDLPFVDDIPVAPKKKATATATKKRTASVTEEKVEEQPIAEPKTTTKSPEQEIDYTAMVDDIINSMSN